MKEREISVVKFGTGVLSTTEGGLNYGIINRFAGEISRVVKTGQRVAIVSSGAMLAGRQKIQQSISCGGVWPESRDEETVDHLQVLSCFGQAELIRAWNRAFESYGYPCAQVLLTNRHFSGEEYRRNLRSKIEICLNAGGIPVFNENDWETAAEIANGFSDNDELARLTAIAAEARRLILLSVVDGYFAGGKLLKLLTGEEIFEELGGSSSALAIPSRGGGKSKLVNSHLAMAVGIDVYIANGKTDGVITDILLHGKNPGTFGRGRK